jgi:hypothetical protein
MTTPAADARIARARSIARMLDSAVRIPGTNIRFGLDAIVGLIPGLGDVAGAVFAGYVILLSSQLGVSRSVIARMVANVAVDTAVGTVPALGDVFDVVWKSNLRNVALLERAAGDSTAPPVNKGIIAAALLVLVLLIAAGIAVAVLIIKAVANAF